MKSQHLSWPGIVRLGLVQSALGAIVALTTSTLNRVMVVEEAMPAILPAAFVAWHYAIQLSRPHWGYGSDIGGRRTPWIISGMAMLALGGFGAALGTALWKLRANAVLPPATHQAQSFYLYAAIFLLFTFFAVSNFVRASRRERRCGLAPHRRRRPRRGS